MTDNHTGIDTSAEAVERLARKICASESEIWDEAPQSFRDRWMREAIEKRDDLPTEVVRLRKKNASLHAQIAAAERNGRLKERICVADWAENTAFDGYLDGDSAERIAKMIRALPLPPSTRDEPCA